MTRSRRFSFSAPATPRAARWPRRWRGWTGPTLSIRSRRGPVRRFGVHSLAIGRHGGARVRHRGRALQVGRASSATPTSTPSSPSATRRRRTARSGPTRNASSTGRSRTRPSGRTTRRRATSASSRPATISGDGSRRSSRSSRRTAGTPARVFFPKSSADDQAASRRGRRRPGTTPAGRRARPRAARRAPRRSSARPARRRRTNRAVHARPPAREERVRDDEGPVRLGAHRDPPEAGRSREQRTSPAVPSSRTRGRARRFRRIRPSGPE